MDYKELVTEAQKAKEFSYSPYSKFRVGAAVQTNDNKVYRGCNIENSSYGLTNCAERTALFKAISEGEKPNSFKAIAIVSDLHDYCTPCGACRQVLSDLCGGNVDVVLATTEGQYKILKLSDLLPFSFGDKELQKR